MSKKRIFRDVLINLFAASLCTIALNFVVYPVFAKKYDSEDYGNILTVIGVINLLIAVFGNCLNNTRLVLNRKENCNNEAGNYNPLAFIASFVGCIIGIIIYISFEIKSLCSVILLCITLLFGISRAYYVVHFRLKLDYFTQLKTNIIVSTGYIIGSVLSGSISWWPLPFCIGESISFFYTIKKSKLIKEPYVFTKDKRMVVSTYSDLILTGLIGNLITYFDRFMINPILGATSVAVFSVSSFWGKAVTPFISPIANVMLSYLSQKDSEMTLRKYVILFMSSVIPLLVFGVVGIWVAPWITGKLYPTLIHDALPFLLIASIGSLIQSSTNLLMPVLLSVCSSRMILGLQGIFFIIYLIIAYIGAKIGGLMGFCYSTCIIGCIKTLLFFFAGYYFLRKQTRKITKE